jgi:hypothetical protein
VSDGSCMGAEACKQSPPPMVSRILMVCIASVYRSRLEKVALAKAAGKAPPKKGQGKRSGKK